jgi:hypothetical protein
MKDGSQKRRQTGARGGRSRAKKDEESRFEWKPGKEGTG